MPVTRGARGPVLAALASVLLAGLILPAPPALAVARVVEGGLIRLHYNRTPLKEIAAEIGRALGERVAIDPGMPGTFTLTIDRPVTRDEALALLDAALIMQGYAMLRADDGTLQILQIQDAATASPWSGPLALEADRNQLVTTLVSLERASVEDVASQIKHLVSSQDSMVAYAPSNSLILTGTERRVRRMIELAQALDVGGGDDLWVRTLRHRGAVEVSEMLRQAFDPASVTPGLRDFGGLQVWADERTHTLLVLASSELLNRVRAFVSEIDQPPGVDTAIRVVRVYNRDAKEIAELLSGKLADAPAGSPDVVAVGPEPLEPGFFVVADEQTNSLVVDADTETFGEILALLEKLDRAQPRVQVDVVAYEITNPRRLRLGVDWFLPVLEPNSDGSGNILSLASLPSGGGLRQEPGDDITFFGRISRDPLLVPFEDANGNVVDVVIPRETAVITADSREVQARALMRPRLLMVSGEEQRIFAGQNVPVLVGSSQGQSGVQTSNQVERRDVGVELRATARTGQEGEVTLDLFIEISRLTLSEAGDPSLVGPTIDNRKIETTVRLADGELAVIGISQQGARDEGRSGTPFLKDIPVLGLAFSSGGSRNQDTHIIFGVQARLLKTPEEDLAESVRQRLALERSLSRVGGLRRNPDAPYAVLVTTRTHLEDATAIAAGLEREGHLAQVGSWEYAGGTRHDVYLTGYVTLSAAGAASLALSERGFAPQVMVLPGEIDIAKAPGLRMLGADLPFASGRPPSPGP